MTIGTSILTLVLTIALIPSHSEHKCVFASVGVVGT